jgi:hypothetical protein
MTIWVRRALLCSIIASVVLFVVCSVAAYIQRGYIAAGGEFGALLIPFFVYVVLCARG